MGRPRHRDRRRREHDHHPYRIRLHPFRYTLAGEECQMDVGGTVHALGTGVFDADPDADLGGILALLGRACDWDTAQDLSELEAALREFVPNGWLQLDSTGWYLDVPRPVAEHYALGLWRG
jgi:hypothetical protein